MGFCFGDTEKIEKGEVTREMEREIRFRKDGERERERGRRNKRKGNEREGSIEGDGREVRMKGREDGGEEEEIKDGRGVFVQGGRLTGGVRRSVCVCVCVCVCEGCCRFSLGRSCKEWDFRIHCPLCLKARVCVRKRDNVFLCVSGLFAV